MKIDKEIPIPKTGGGKNNPKYPWDDMKIGDSFFVPKQTPSFTRTAYSYAHTHGLDWKFTARTVTENRKKGVRIWRIK